MTVSLTGRHACPPVMPGVFLRGNRITEQENESKSSEEFKKGVKLQAQSICPIKLPGRGFCFFHLSFQALCLPEAGCEYLHTFSFLNVCEIHSALKIKTPPGTTWLALKQLRGRQDL